MFANDNCWSFSDLVLLNKGLDVKSNNGAYQLYLQDDGNLVLYKLLKNGRKPLWSSYTFSGDNSQFVLQKDGNAVLYYNQDGSPRSAAFSTATSGNGNTLCLQDDGNMVIYSSNREKPLWASHTAQDSTSFVPISYKITNEVENKNFSVYFVYISLKEVKKDHDKMIKPQPSFNQVLLNKIQKQMDESNLPEHKLDGNKTVLINTMNASPVNTYILLKRDDGSVFYSKVDKDYFNLFKYGLDQGYKNFNIAISIFDKGPLYPSYYSHVYLEDNKSKKVPGKEVTLEFSSLDNDMMFSHSESLRSMSIMAESAIGMAFGIAEIGISLERMAVQAEAKALFVREAEETITEGLVKAGFNKPGTQLNVFNVSQEGSVIKAEISLDNKSYLLEYAYGQADTTVTLQAPESGEVIGRYTYSEEYDIGVHDMSWSSDGI